jgi:hypothetical protein
MPVNNNKELEINEIVEKILEEQFSGLINFDPIYFKDAIFEYSIDSTDADTDDPCETATIELELDKCECCIWDIKVIKHRFEYSYRYNKSTGESRVSLKVLWRNYSGKEYVLNIEDSQVSAFSYEQLYLLDDLAEALNFHSSSEQFIRFLLMLLSRSVQTNLLKIEDHGIYLRFLASSEKL